METKLVPQETGKNTPWADEKNEKNSIGALLFFCNTKFIEIPTPHKMALLAAWYTVLVLRPEKIPLCSAGFVFLPSGYSCVFPEGDDSH